MQTQLDPAALALIMAPEIPVFFWWQSGTLFHAQRGGVDPSEIYTSTDIPDALEQAGYDRTSPGLSQVMPNQSPPDIENYF